MKIMKSVKAKKTTESTKIEFEPVGYVRSDIKDTSSAPRHHSVSDQEGIIEIKPELADGLYRLEERTHLVILFYFHKSNEPLALHQKPPQSDSPKGVFSTCSPNRPNPIGMDVVELVKVEGNKIHIKNIDMLDGTPVLDIKPYKPL
jgi:tRNA (adenine37-N6)-methyltransferase